MGLVAEVGSFASNTGTGNQTVNLGSSFNGITPMAVMLWTVGGTTADSNLTDAVFSHGWGTRDAGATQQWYQSVFGDAGTDPSAVVRGRNTTAILKSFTSDSTTPDAEYSLVSLNSGTPSNFVVNVVDAPAAAIKIMYCVLGGTDITAARAGSFTVPTSGTPQDVTVVASFGKPDFIFFSTAPNNTGDVQGNATMGFQVGKNDTERFGSNVGLLDASAATAISTYQKQQCFTGITAAGAIDFEGELSAKASWPTDGFQISWFDFAASSATGNFYVALKGTFQSVIGENSSLTSGGPTDNACGFVPVVAGIFGANQLNTGTPITTGTGLGAWYIGATDGTNERWAGWSADDALATNARYDARYSESKTLVMMTPETPTVEAEADGSFSGNNFRLSYSDFDTTNRQYGWWALGAAAAGAATSFPPVPYPPTRYLPLGGGF